jgi:hypothetical protein
MNEEQKEQSFEVTELDDGELDGAAGGLAEPNNCNCPINNCDVD